MPSGPAGSKRLHKQAAYKTATSVETSQCQCLLSGRCPYKRGLSNKRREQPVSSALRSVQREIFQCFLKAHRTLLALNSEWWRKRRPGAASRRVFGLGAFNRIVILLRMHRMHR